ENYKILKNSENYKKLNSNMAQQVLKEVDGSFKSFFGLLKLAKNGQYDNKKIKLPKYLAKDGFTTLVIGFVRLKDGMLIIPYSNSFRKTHKEIAIKLPPVLKGKKIKEIRIIPKQHSRYFEIQYIYEVEEVQRELNENNVLGIDLGIDNLCTCVTNTGASF
ncbi:transposase, partial [Fusobacterium polymorphum]